jgi:putative FmdB family regulatory protein
MPVYTYHCEKCENEFEKYQTFSEEPLSICPQCGETALRKVYKPALVMFKGSGYYVTDHRSAKSSLNSTDTKSASDNGSGDSKTKSKPDKPKESKTKDTPESKSK